MGKFTQALRQIIRQEMRDVLTEELLPILKDVLSEQRQPMHTKPRHRKPASKKTFSKNSILNVTRKQMSLGSKVALSN